MEPSALLRPTPAADPLREVLLADRIDGGNTPILSANTPGCSTSSS